MKPDDALERRIVTWKVFAFSLAVFYSSAWASPPDGIPPQDAQEAFSKADVVFLGRIEKVFKDTYGYESTAEVEVQRPDGTRLRILYSEAAPMLVPLLQTFLEVR